MHKIFYCLSVLFLVGAVVCLILGLVADKDTDKMYKNHGEKFYFELTKIFAGLTIASILVAHFCAKHPMSMMGMGGGMLKGY